jgi:hypothetical protein
VVGGGFDAGDELQITVNQRRYRTARAYDAAARLGRRA